MRDRAGPHGEDISQDTTDAGGGALVRFDEARVVVAFGLEHGRHAAADIDDAGVLAGAANDPGRFGRQLGEPVLRGFVGSNARSTSPRRYRARRLMGGRSRISRISLYSSSERPCSAICSGVIGSLRTVMTAPSIRARNIGCAIGAAGHGDPRRAPGGASGRGHCDPGPSMPAMSSVEPLGLSQ